MFGRYQDSFLAPATNSTHLQVQNIDKNGSGGLYMPLHHMLDNAMGVKLHGPSMFAVKAKIIECYIIKPAQSLLMKHLVIGQR